MNYFHLIHINNNLKRRILTHVASRTWKRGFFSKNDNQVGPVIIGGSHVFFVAHFSIEFTVSQADRFNFFGLYIYNDNITHALRARANHDYNPGVPAILQIERKTAPQPWQTFIADNQMRQSEFLPQAQQSVFQTPRTNRSWAPSNSFCTFQNLTAPDWRQENPSVCRYWLRQSFAPLAQLLLGCRPNGTKKGSLMRPAPKEGRPSKEFSACPPERPQTPQN
jgi:hypothetical protein